MSTTTFAPALVGPGKQQDEGPALSTLYHRLADVIQHSIDKGIFRAGEKIPSVRKTSQQHRMSISTVLRAYLLLESRGVIESRPQSGYFVRPRSAMPTVPAAQPDGPLPEDVDVARLMLSTLRAIQMDDAVPFGSPYPNPALLPCERIAQYANTQSRRHSKGTMLDDLPPGNPAFIRQLARRYVENGQQADPNEFVVTIGATEAVRLCLQAVARPGDAIVVESPSYYGTLETIAHLGMHAVEVATDSSGSIDMGELARAVGGQRIAACMLTANHPNPLGRQMPEEKKRALVKFLTSRDIPIIENDEYSELYFGATHPTSLKSYDTRGLVLHCGSFSRCLTHRHRIGWALPGRFRQQVEKLKFLSTLTTPANVQLALAEYLKNDGYDHHLRRLRKVLAQNANIMRSAVQRFFPAGTRTSMPIGGYVLWVELPQQANSLALYRDALACGITIAPGRLFGTSGQFNHHLRLNFSGDWTPATEHAIRTLGQMVSTSVNRSC